MNRDEYTHTVQQWPDKWPAWLISVHVTATRNGRTYIRRHRDGRWIYPRPLPIDGHAYRRRTRNRRKK